jgi:hypothetical protein
VIAHLVGLVGSSVTVTFESEAIVEAGTPEKNVVRTVTENSRTLKFTTQRFRGGIKADCDDGSTIFASMLSGSARGL